MKGRLSFLALAAALALSSCENGLVATGPADAEGAAGDSAARAATAHYLATQYWTWYSPGATAPMWDGVSAYGQPLQGWYDSNDPAVAANHIATMLGNGINALSYTYVNKAGDGTMWYADILDPDQAFRNGAMQASNFSSIKFFVSYDLATRAALVHNAENGLQWGHPEGMDVLPWVSFDDPGMRSANYPSFNFNVKDSNGFYIYDELLEHDFKNFAENYFNKPNYLRINGQCVVFIYNSWRFNNGGAGNATDGFARAFQRIRGNIYNWYGHKLYLAGDFVSYNNKGKAATYRTGGYYKWYDAVNGWNVYDDPYRGAHGNLTSLSTYTAVSKTVQDAFRPQVKYAARSYRSGLPEPARSAYGPATAKVDFIPLLSFSFRRHDGADGYWSSVITTAQVEAELNMVKTQRANSLLAEESATLVYNVAFNQWNEGQHIEAAVDDPSAPYPGKYAWRYLGSIKSILGN